MGVEQTVRRPIAARHSSWAAAISRRLVRMGLKPNQVSILSVVFAAFAAAALALTWNMEPAVRAALLIVAAAAIQLRLLCNLLDGMIAIEGGLKSKTGELYNDLPDRISDVLIMVAAGYAARGIPVAIELGWLAGSMALMTAYIRLLGASAGAGHQFGGPMAKQQRMVTLTVACTLAIAEPSLGLRGQVFVAALAIIVVGCLATIVRRLRRMARTLEAAP